MMLNDKRQPVKEAYPGEAVHMVGFKEFPDVGNPLYVVNSSEEAKFIISKVKKRAETELRRKQALEGNSTLAHNMKKTIGKLTKSEKVSLRKGDKSVLYEKLGLIEEKDLKAYQSKFGIDKDQMKTEEDLAKNLEDKHMISEKR